MRKRRTTLGWWRTLCATLACAVTVTSSPLPLARASDTDALRPWSAGKDGAVAQRLETTLRPPGSEVVTEVQRQHVTARLERLEREGRVASQPIPDQVHALLKAEDYSLLGGSLLLFGLLAAVMLATRSVDWDVLTARQKVQQTGA